jgi:hypothetical protein
MRISLVIPFLYYYQNTRLRLQPEAKDRAGAN